MSNKPVFALIAAILASSMAFIDSTALNVALPAIQKSLNLSGAQLLWVVNGYTLFLASLMLVGGALGDIFGKKRVFTLGVFAFVIASLGCGLSPNGITLIVLRAIQGMAAALMVPGSLALISAVYPRAKKGKAIGYWSMFSALTTILGPVLGGYLASIGWWRVVFFINVPLGVVALILLLKYVNEPRIAAPNQKLDVRGAVLSAVSLTLIVFSFIQGGEHGFDNWYLWATLAVGLSLFAAFICFEKGHKSPLLRLSLFRSRVFTVANVITFLIYGGLGVFMYFLPLNLIQIQGYSAELAGLATLPFGACIALLAPLSGRWIDRVGPRVPLSIGPLLTGAGFWGFSLFGITDGWTDYASTFLPFMLLAGVGMGLSVVPVTTSVMNAVSDDDAGSASGINNTLSRLSGVIALALVGMLALLAFEKNVISAIPNHWSESDVAKMETQAARFSGASADVFTDSAKREKARRVFDQSFLSAYHSACAAAAILCWLSALLAWFMISSGKEQSAALKKSK